MTDPILDFEQDDAAPADAEPVDEGTENDDDAEPQADDAE
jgi:hypothetical protein